MLRLLVISIAAMALQACGCTVVDPGHRGVKVHLGEVTPQALPEGLVWHMPLLTSVNNVSVQQQTSAMNASCFSSDMQEINLQLKVLYRLPENRIVALFQQYAGDPFNSLVAPRVAEAIKEVTALETAESIAKNRERIKTKALDSAKAKIGELIIVEDIVMENIALSKELATAIENKMVQQQEAAKAEFTKIKAKTDAETAVIRAQGEADAIRIRGAAIKENPRLIELQIAEKWNGVAPLVVGNGEGANILLPVNNPK